MVRLITAMNIYVFRYDNIMSVVVPQPYTVQIQVSLHRYIIIYTHKVKKFHINC